MSLEQVLRDNLNDDQLAAATDDSSEILCLACAGSGKSRTLAFRIARLIAEGEDSSNIVALTFTEKAADSIKRRVGQALLETGLDPAVLGAMYLGTIHSYCKHLLCEMDARYRQFDVLDANRLKLYLISRYPRLGLHNLRRERGNCGYFECIRKVAEAWGVCNDEVLALDEITVEDATLGAVLENVRNGLIEDEYLDFSLMIRLIVDAIAENNELLNAALENINHLMVDEYQDVNPAQELLIAGIHDRGANLFVVGDDDQAIYGWRGADVNNILEFRDRYANCSEHTLRMNYRSVPTIIRASSDFIERQLGPSRISKNPIHSQNNENKDSQVGKYWFDNRNDEAQWVAERVNDLLGKSFEENDSNIGTRGICPSDIAILMASTNGSEQDGTYRHTAFTNALEALNIPYTIEAQGSIFNSPLANTLRDTFELLRDPVLDRTTLRQHFDSVIIPNFENADFGKVAEVMSNWLRSIHEPISGGRRKISPQQFLHELLNAFGIQNTEFDDVQMQILGIFSKIMEDIEAVYVSIDSTSRFREILNFLNILAEGGYELSPDEVLQRPNAVFVSTIHKAKGLEFPVVFLVDVENGRLPGTRRNYNGWIPQSPLNNALSLGRYQNTREGDIRVFYTAITRAERYLYITACEHLPGGSRRRRQSVFTETLDHVDITQDVAEFPRNLVEMPNDRIIQRIDETVMPTNYSQIKYYLVCPRNYQFKNQFGFRAFIPELYGFGQTTHASIASLHQSFTERAPTEDEAEEVSRSTFSLKHVPQSRDPENSPGPYERALEKSVEVVKDYVRDYGHDFTVERKVEVRFEIPAHQCIITGAIDLLLKEDDGGNIIEATVIDFKSMTEPDAERILDWIDLSLQVQFYAKAATDVLGENARTGAVHLLRDDQRIEVPITDEAVGAAIQNIEWAVDRIINRDYPMRPHSVKCQECDFKLLCPSSPAQFSVNNNPPPPISIPDSVSTVPLMIRAFSEFEES